MSTLLFGDMADFVVGGVDAGVTSFSGCVNGLDAMVNRPAESSRAVVATVKTVSFSVNNIDAAVTRFSGLSPASTFVSRLAKSSSLGSPWPSSILAWLDEVSFPFQHSPNKGPKALFLPREFFRFYENHYVDLSSGH